jgi:hypothetical protein
MRLIKSFCHLKSPQILTWEEPIWEETKKMLISYPMMMSAREIAKPMLIPNPTNQDPTLILSQILVPEVYHSGGMTSQMTSIYTVLYMIFLVET